VFVGTLLAFTLLRFALVSTTPVLFALLLFVLVVLVPQAIVRLTATIVQTRIPIRFIRFLPPVLTVNLFTAIPLPFIFKISGVFVILGFNAHQNATVFDAFFIILNALFRDAGAD